MNIRLLDKPSKDIPTKVQLCINRGVDLKQIPAYLGDTYEHINPPTAFEENLLRGGATLLINAISNNDKTFVIVDSDVDGWTSAAHLINYLYEVVPSWTQNYVSYGLHQGKQHGINDFVDTILEGGYKLLLVPDAGTNDKEAIAKLYEAGCKVVILDHHISDVGFSEYAVTINSQYNYPNPFLSGVGVVHKFCQYLDELMNKNFANEFLDLTAIGMMGDMMDIRNLETKEMIFQGLRDENLKNPLIEGLAEKAAYALSKPDYVASVHNHLRITPMGAAFFIIPLLNALSRSGTMEEKLLVFESMLSMKAFEEIPSNKRGHKPGDMEQRVIQALRTCTNVKNRQTRAEDAGMALLTSRAEKMLDNKVLVFTLNPGEVDPNIAGLVANKLASQYQRPCCVTTKSGDMYAGSMRGYTATGIDDFKTVAETSDSCDWVRGHENAAGICITNPDSFVTDMNEQLKDVSSDIVYYVDYMWDAESVNDMAIVEMAEMNDYLGTGFHRPQVFVHDFIVTDKNFQVMGSNTLRFVLPNGVTVIKFGGTEEEVDMFKAGNVKIDFVAKCNINDYNFSPQLMMLDYEVKPYQPSVQDIWGF